MHKRDPSGGVDLLACTKGSCIYFSSAGGTLPSLQVQADEVPYTDGDAQYKPRLSELFDGSEFEISVARSRESSLSAEPATVAFLVFVHAQSSCQNLPSQPAVLLLRPYWREQNVGMRQTRLTTSGS